MSIKQLPYGIVKLISSTQVISCITSVVKELVENSIDAEATVIDIKLERYGLDKIEVRDNGTGINSSDIHSVCKPNHTSKIYSLEDLEALKSYGFRGEALNSICAVSNVSITTRTEQDEVASVYTFDRNGSVRETQQSHQMRGTTITVTSLFKNVPVRRQYYDSVRKASEELKKIEKVVKILSVIHPKLRVTISHNKCLIWHKTAVNTLKQSLMQMYQHVVLKNLEYFSHSVENFSLEMLISKRDCNWSVLLQPTHEAILFFINQRPVKDKKVEKIVVEEMSYLFQSALPTNKCPLTLISLKLPSCELDVNLEPDKTKVFIRNHDDVLKQIRECVALHFYKQPLREVEPAVPQSAGEQTDADTEENPPKRPKLGNSRRSESEDLSGNSPYNSSAEDTSCRDPPIESSSSSGDEPFDPISSLTSNFIDESEDCDMLAAKNIVLEETNDEVQAENIASNLCWPIPADSSPQSANINSESTLSSDDSTQCSPVMTFECDTTLEQYICNFSESNFNVEELQPCTDSVPQDSPTKVTDCKTISSNQESVTPYNLLKNMKNFEREISPEARSRLSISGNLVDDLFQSQVGDDEEIILQSAEISAFNESAQYATSPRRSSCEGRDTSTSDLPANEEKGIRTDVSQSDGITPRSKDNTNNMNSTNLTQTTLSQWSKGHAVVNNQPLKGPSSVLLSVKDSSSGKQTSSESPSLLERSVSSQMGRKDLAGLTNFARSARLELIESNPGMSFTRVAGELAKRWRGLDEFQKNKYVEKATAKKIHPVTPISNVSKSKDLLKKVEVDCKTSIDGIKTRLMEFKNNKMNNYRIVKAFQSGKVYLCRVGQEIVVVHIQNLQRNVIHDRYICYSSLSSRCLNEPLELTEKIIGNQYWTLLISMDRTSNDDETATISDPRLLKNGFRIVLEETLGEIEMWLTGVAEELTSDFVQELRETLQLASLHPDVASCRSVQVQQILRKKANEAFCDTNIESDDVEALLDYWVQHKLQEKCNLSGDRVIVKLCTL